MFLISSFRQISIGVYEHNKVAIDQVKNPISSSNGNYIDVRHHILSEMAFSGHISVQYIRSDDQHADKLTKALDTLESPS